MSNDIIGSHVHKSPDVFECLVSMEFVLQLRQFVLIVFQERVDVWLSLLQVFYKILQFDFYLIADLDRGVFQLLQ